MSNQKKMMLLALQTQYYAHPADAPLRLRAGRVATTCSPRSAMSAPTATPGMTASSPGGRSDAVAQGRETPFDENKPVFFKKVKLFLFVADFKDRWAINT